MTLTVGYAQVAICRLPLTNGAKVFGCISVLIFFCLKKYRVIVDIDLNCTRNDARVRFYNLTKCPLAYRYLQHHCQPFYSKLLSSHLDGQGTGKIIQSPTATY